MAIMIHEIKNARLQTVGKIFDEGDGFGSQFIQDRTGAVVGRYQGSSNTTRSTPTNSSGRVVGYGNLLTTLITMN